MKYALLFLCLTTAFADTEVINIGEKFTLNSKIMGEERTVLVHLPAGYQNGNDRYPVLYLTDGDAQLLHTTGTIEFLARTNRMPQMIVVAVANTDRTRDLTPTPSDEQPMFNTSGGADRFLSFFTDELAPHIEKHYRTQPYKVFAGHSFGGLFAVNAFLEKPDAFNAFIAVSPSLWWDNEVMVKRAEEFFAEKKPLNTALYLTLGSEGDRMELPLKKFLAVLEKNPVEGFRYDSMIMPDEDHGSVVLRSHYHALKMVFDGWMVPRDQPRTLDSMMAHYEKLSKRMGYTIQVPENTVNGLGYGAMNDNIDDAIRIFKWNVKHYPKSSNVYDSLAEAQENKGLLEEARANYEKAWKRGKETGSTNTELYRANMERVTEKLAKAGS